MTVEIYFETHAIEGRAALGRKTPFEPPTWISKATAHGRVSYWLCRRDEFAIEQLEANADVKAIRWRPTRKPRGWHQAILRPMPIAHQLTA